MYQIDARRGQHAESDELNNSHDADIEDVEAPTVERDQVENSKEEAQRNLKKRNFTGPCLRLQTFLLIIKG